MRSSSPLLAQRGLQSGVERALQRAAPAGARIPAPWLSQGICQRPSAHIQESVPAPPAWWGGWIERRGRGREARGATAGGGRRAAGGGRRAAGARGGVCAERDGCRVRATDPCARVPRQAPKGGEGVRRAKYPPVVARHVRCGAPARAPRPPRAAGSERGAARHPAGSSCGAGRSRGNPTAARCRRCRGQGF